MHTPIKYEPIFEPAEETSSSAFNDGTFVEYDADPFIVIFDPSHELLRTYEGLAAFFRNSVVAVMLIKILLRMTYDQIDSNTYQTLLEYARWPVPPPILCNNLVNPQVQIGDTFVFHSLLTFYHGDMSVMRGEWCKVGSVDFYVRMLKRERIDTSNEIYRKFKAEHATECPQLFSRELIQLSRTTAAESEREATKTANKAINAYNYQLKRNSLKGRRYNGPYKISTRGSPLHEVVSSSGRVHFDAQAVCSTNLAYHQPEALQQPPAYSDNTNSLNGSISLNLMQPPDYLEAIQSSLTALGPGRIFQEKNNPYDEIQARIKLETPNSGMPIPHYFSSPHFTPELISVL